MRAFKLHGHVEKDHTLSLRLPDDVAEGPAEVIVLLPEERQQSGHSLEDFLAALSRSPRRILSKEEIDRDLESERESWDS